ncbi:MAG TPA: hypothetical protein VKA54_18035 [Gemmatimonadaceae bacterium]|nr:hypothetical protein [Gemmatimonadaceae bacterium]
MTTRRTILAVFVLAAATDSCAALANKSSPSTTVSSARPRERMAATRRREGSDVTTREGPDRGWFIGAGLACDAGDSAKVKPQFDRKCEGTDPAGEVDRTPRDTAWQKAP